MPTNCSTLIQRKQNILHKILRSSSDEKIHNAVAETTSELRVAGTQKIVSYSASVNHINPPSTPAQSARRTNLFTTNRVQPANEQLYETHLPSIRDASGPVDRTQQTNDDIHPRSRPKTPLTQAAVSPKSVTRPPSASISSLFNTLAKRSTENFHSSNGEIDDLRTTPQSRQSRRPSNESSKYATNQTPTKHTYPVQKYSGDSGVESRHSTSPLDVNQQYRMSTYSTRMRSDNSPGHDATKEKTSTGQLYQRRANNNIKAPTKQKIDKYRRRSEEVTQATTNHTNALFNAAHTGLSATTPALPTTTTSARIKPPSTPKPVRRVTSDAEIQARLEVLRLSMESNVHQTDQANVRHRSKSPYLYSTHQQLGPPTTPQTSTALRRSQAISSSTHNSNRQTQGVTYRRQQQQQQQQSTNNKQSQNSNQGNLYLAFIASRHLSTLEDTLFDCDIDHPKLLRIFTWLKNIEEHRHEQADHDQLIREQNQLMLDREDNLSLYSEIQYAVDDLPPNMTGKPCEKIPTMQFEE